MGDQAEMDSSRFLSALPPNQPILWQVAHKNLDCRGEVIIAEQWRGEWGQELSKDAQFRIVILTRPQIVPPSSLLAPRVAVCLPSPEHALRESAAPYLVAEDTPAYSSGNIISKLPLPLSPQQVFSLPDNRQRLDLLARALLTVNDVQHLKSYLDAIEVPESQKELALDRLSILEQLDPARLLANPHLWASLEALLDWFASRYRPLYLNHHHTYHQAAASLHDRLLKVEPELAALRRLNSIIELGSPLEEGLFSQYQELETRLRPCPLWESAAEPEIPCPTCGLKLTDQVPQREAERFLNQLETALGRQLRRLSSQAICHILAQSHEAKIEQFLKVIQASEARSLAHVLDDELVDFLRELLAR